MTQLSIPSIYLFSFRMYTFVTNKHTHTHINHLHVSKPHHFNVTYWILSRVSTISQTAFSNSFLERKCLNFDSDVTDYCYYVGIDPGNGGGGGGGGVPVTSFTKDLNPQLATNQLKIKVKPSLIGWTQT